MSRLNWNSLSGGRGPLPKESWEPEPVARPSDRPHRPKKGTPSRSAKRKKARPAKVRAGLAKSFERNAGRKAVRQSVNAALRDTKRAADAARSQLQRAMETCRQLRERLRDRQATTERPAIRRTLSAQCDVLRQAIEEAADIAATGPEANKAIGSLTDAQALLLHCRQVLRSSSPRKDVAKQASATSAR
jgi:hypothetical protein